MRRVALILLLAMFLGGAYFAVVLLLREDAGARVLAELPGPVRAAVPQGRGLFVAADTGGLLHVDLDSGAVKPLLDAAGQHFLDVVTFNKLVYVLAVTDDRKSILHTVDTGKGELRNQSISSSASDLVGFLEDGTLVVVEGSQVRFMKPDGTTNHVPVGGGVLNGGWLGEGKLYVARGYTGGVAVIDMQAAPKLLDVIETTDWLLTVAVAGKIAYVRGQTGPGLVDLETRGYRSLKARDVWVAPGGTVFAIGSDAVWRLDENGKPSDTSQLPEWLTEQLRGERPFIVAAGDGEVIIAHRNKLFTVNARFTGMSPVAQADAGAR